MKEWEWVKFPCVRTQNLTGLCDEMTQETKCFFKETWDFKV